jgi:hypothetical protein
MSFTSSIPAPQKALKVLPVNLDYARFTEKTGVSIYMEQQDTLQPSEAQTLYGYTKSTDTSHPADTALGGPNVYGVLLRIAGQSDTVLSTDFNSMVDALKAKLSNLYQIGDLLASTKPDVATQLQTLVSQLETLINSMPTVKTGDKVYATHYNAVLGALRNLLQIEELLVNASGSPADMSQLLSNMRTLVASAMEKKTGDIVRHVDWNTLKQALGYAPAIEDKVPIYLATTVYLFNEHDWATAKQYVTDYSIIFSWYDISTLSPDEVSSLVATKKVVFVVEVDTQPYYLRNAPAWYNVFYTVLAPSSCGMCVSNVTDPDFQRFLGTSVPCDIDYNVSLSYKVSGAKNWTGDSCGWGYKRYEQGAIIEVPYDGFWQSADWLGKYVDAISNILLGVSKPARILYLGGYTSSNANWHACYPIDACWGTIAQQRGWIIKNLRT